MKYRVANVEIDTQQFTFTDSGEAVAVEPKVFDVIVYLINHRDNVVSRDELFAQVWAGREVSDTTLSNHIKSARKLFGDNGELQKVIKTIRGRGYQFIAAIEESNEPSMSARVKPTNSVATISPASIEKPPFIFVKPLMMLFVTVILLATGAWLGLSGESDNLAEEQRPLVMVLPFGVSSVENEKWQPFADQMTREVIRKLSHVSALRVIPAASTFALTQQTSHHDIRQKLPQVRFVLEAMVNVSGNSEIRITADMTDLESATLLWDRDFETQINESNFFSIQNNIATTVADSLQIVLGDKEQHVLSALPTEDLAAYELYVAGHQQLSMLNHQSLLQAIDLFDQAIALDPGFTLALVAKADAYRIIMAYFEKPAHVLPDVISSVNAALRQDPQSAEALSSLGLAYVLAWRWEDAWKILNKAKSINPELALTELGFALYYAAMGNESKSMRTLEKANRLDPLNIEVADWGHWALAMVGNLDAAREWAGKQIRLHPEVGMIYSGASVSAALAGHHARAIELAQTGVTLDPGSPYAYLALAQAFGYAGQTDKIPALLQQAESLNQYMCPYETAINYIILNDLDRAFSLFNEAVSSRSNCLVFTRNDQRLSPVKNDPRYKTLLTRIGLDDRSLAEYAR